MKILALDISTKTGWSKYVTDLDGNHTLQSSGVTEKLSEPNGKYPFNYLSWARQVSRKIIYLIDDFRPDYVIIEETTTSRNNLSQKVVEWCHFCVVDWLEEHKDIEVIYYRTGQWRSLTDCHMSNQEKNKNKKRSKLKKTTEDGKLVKDENGKVLGKVTTKHVSVRKTNELFGLNLKLKDEDESDAILLGLAACIELKSKLK